MEKVGPRPTRKPTFSMINGGRGGRAEPRPRRAGGRG